MPIIDVVVDAKGAIKGKREVEGAFEDIKHSARKNLGDMDNYGKKVKGSFDNLKSSVFSLKGAIAGIGVALAVREMMSLVKVASDLEEVTSKFNTVYAGQQKQAEAWAKTLVASYAMSTREAKQYLSSVQDLLVPMGMNAIAAGKLSSEIVKLSADLGSFNNQPTAKVMDDIQSALVGNFETMKKYGVVLNATVVEQKAMTMGLVNTKEELTAGTKAQAAYALMVQGSAAAIGDMARTSGGYANQAKQLEANIEDLKAMLGNELLPVATDIVKTMNNWVKANDALIKQSVQTTVEKISSALSTVADIYNTLPPEIVSFAGWGLVGRILFGGTGGLVLATLAGVASATSRAVAEIKELKTIYDATMAGMSLKDYTAIFGGGKSGGKGAGGSFSEYADGVANVAKALLEESKAVVAATTGTDSFAESMLSGANESAHLAQALKDLKDKYFELDLAAVSARSAIDPGDDYLGLWFPDNIPERAKATLEIIEGEVKNNAREIGYIYEEMIKNIQDFTADTFYDIFSGNLEDWGDLLDSMKDMFLRWLAEISAAAVVRGIVVPIVFGASGGSGSGGILGASTMGGSGDDSLMGYVLQGLGLAKPALRCIMGRAWSVWPIPTFQRPYSGPPQTWLQWMPVC